MSSITGMSELSVLLGLSAGTVLLTSANSWSQPQTYNGGIIIPSGQTITLNGNILVINGTSFTITPQLLSYLYGLTSNIQTQLNAASTSTYLLGLANTWANTQTFNGTVNANNILNLNSGCTIVQASTTATNVLYATLFSGLTTCNNGLYVLGTTNLGGTLSVSAGISCGTATITSLTSAGTSYFNNINLSGNLNVNGELNLNTNAVITQSSITGANILYATNFSGLVSCNNSLYVSGSTNCAGSVGITAGLSCAGTASLTNITSSGTNNFGGTTNQSGPLYLTNSLSLSSSTWIIQNGNGLLGYIPASSNQLGLTYFGGNVYLQGTLNILNNLNVYGSTFSIAQVQNALINTQDLTSDAQTQFNTINTTLSSHTSQLATQSTNLTGITYSSGTTTIANNLVVTGSFTAPAVIATNQSITGTYLALSFPCKSTYYADISTGNHLAYLPSISTVGAYDGTIINFRCIGNNTTNYTIYSSSLDGSPAIIYLNNTTSGVNTVALSKTNTTIRLGCFGNNWYQL